MLSIITPTLNEEENLERLFTSIVKQQYKDIEFVIADAGSQDKTLEVAEKYGAVITGGGHPGKGRNEGAKVAHGNAFLFLDADVSLPKNFLYEFMEKVQEEKLHAASCRLKIKTKGFTYRLGEAIFNSYFWVTQKFYAHGSNCIYTTKSLHERLRGFDETIKFGEDMDYIRRAAKIEKFGFLWSVYFYASARRFEKEGVFKTFVKYIFAEVLQVFGRRVKFNMFTYEGDKEVKQQKGKNEKKNLS